MSPILQSTFGVLVRSTLVSFDNVSVAVLLSVIGSSLEEPPTILPVLAVRT